MIGRALHHERNKFVYAFMHETVRRISTTTGVGAEAWAEFEASARWRPPHFQVARELVSAPSEFLFESLSREMGADQNGASFPSGIGNQHC